ncbi:MAG: DUF308 domain-containing protein [Candidatus Saccharibacteria bacterium]|nr:DUF308 domain-containing protein [Candidatus Saccharibacteria bacterium]
MSTKRKYIESHWGVFALKGIVSLFAGFYMMFTHRQDVNFLIQVVGWTMLALAIIEVVNVAHRSSRQRNWGFPLGLGVVEMAISVALLYTVNPNATLAELLPLRLSMLAAYVLAASIITVVMGFRSFDNLTDRFMWVVNGMLGCVLGFVIFNAGNISDVAHIMLFGTYLLINGLTDLFFGIHSKDEMKELHAERSARRKKALGASGKEVKK